MLKLTKTNKPIKTRIQNYKDETNVNKLKIYSTFLTLIFAGSTIALNHVLTNMDSVTELTVKNAIEYLITMPIVMASAIGIYFNVDKMQNISKNDPQDKVKTKKRNPELKSN